MPGFFIRYVNFDDTLAVRKKVGSGRIDTQDHGDYSYYIASDLVRNLCGRIPHEPVDQLLRKKVTEAKFLGLFVFRHINSETRWVFIDVQFASTM